MTTMKRTRRKKPRPETPIEPSQTSPELRAGIDRFARAFARILLAKLDPEAARLMAEASGDVRP
jgi:hypothetical protein